MAKTRGAVSRLNEAKTNAPDAVNREASGRFFDGEHLISRKTPGPEKSYKNVRELDADEAGDGGKAPGAFQKFTTGERGERACSWQDRTMCPRGKRKIRTLPIGFRAAGGEFTRRRGLARKASIRRNRCFRLHTP